MKDELTLKDLWLFIKNNLKLILLTVVSLLIVMIGFLLFNYFVAGDTRSTVDQTAEEMEENPSTEDFDRLTEVPFELLNDREITFMQDYVEENAYRFMFFVETENNEPVGNLNMMRAIFRHQNVVEMIEANLGEQLTPDPRISINVVSYADSGLFELQLGRTTRESSEELADVFYNMLLNNDIAVLNQFDITLFEDAPIPLVEPVRVEEVDDDLVVERDNAALLRNLVLYLVAAVMGGLLLGILIAVVKMYFTKTITPLYNYERNFTDRIVRLNHLSDKEKTSVHKAIKNIIYPKQSMKLILINKNLQDKAKEVINRVQLEPNVKILNDFSEMDQSELIDEIIILSEVNITPKQWYSDQRVQLAGYSIPVKVIQF